MGRFIRAPRGRLSVHMLTWYRAVNLCAKTCLCVGGCVGVKVVRVQLNTVQHFHMDRAEEKKNTGISERVLLNAAHSHAWTRFESLDTHVGLKSIFINLF